MDVVAHQYISVYLALESPSEVEQMPKVFPIVDFKDEAGPSVDPTLYHVLRDSRKIKSLWSRHAARLPLPEFADRQELAQPKLGS